MKILHHVKKENSGLMRSALELCHWEERLGLEVCIKEPQGEVLYGEEDGFDLHMIHSQIDPLKYYHDGKPKLMMMHGEPLSSVANGISMKAIVDLASVCSAFICMRKEEQPVWSLIKKTHLITKGVDLERYKPSQETKLPGDPAILYCENWRGLRNPLYLIAAMPLVLKQLPDAKLHLFNVQDAKMHKTFKSMFDYCKLWTFLRSLTGPCENVITLYNQCDIVVSCLFPLYARTAVEALACNKPIVSPGYHEYDVSGEPYPYSPVMTVESLAAEIVRAYRNPENINYREWAERNHSAEKSAKECISIYEREVSSHGGL